MVYYNPPECQYQFKRTDYSVHVSQSAPSVGLAPIGQMIYGKYQGQRRFPNRYTIRANRHKTDLRDKVKHSKRSAKG